MQRIRRALASGSQSPRRRFSQNFLTDPNILRRIADAARINVGDAVFEIGPGPGTLTALLLAAGAHVTAVEVDRDLARFLGQEFAGARLTVIEGDVLKVDVAGLLAERERWTVVANLPYAITSPCLRLLCEACARVERAVLTVQREVAGRLVAAPGSRERGALTVYVDRAFSTEIVRNIPPSAFHPRPKVTSAVVRLEPRSSCSMRAPKSAFERAVRAAFGQRRKMVRKALAGGPSAVPEEWVAALLDAAGLAGSERAEDLPTETFERMAMALATLEGGAS